MPRVLTADIEKGVAQGIPAPTPVRDTYHKGDRVMQLYEVEYHRYAQLLIAAGIWKQHWADGEKYLTGDQMRESAAGDIRLIKDLTHALEVARSDIERHIISNNKLLAQITALEAKPTIPGDPFTDLAERYDEVMKAFEYDPVKERHEISIGRRDSEAKPDKLWILEIRPPGSIDMEDEDIWVYGPTAEAAILEAHKVLDLFLDFNDANDKKTANKIRKQLLKYHELVMSQFDESGTEDEDL